MVYGHRDKTSCQDVELLLPLGEVSEQSVAAALANVTPTGKTPIAYSLGQAPDAFKGQPETAGCSIALISDGIETCDGDPCDVAARLAGSGIMPREWTGWGMRIAATALLALWLSPLIPLHAAGQSANRTARPVDQAVQHPSFAAFRARLIDAVVRRDVDDVVAQASGDIHLSFGGHAGHADFRELLTVPEDSLVDEFKHEAAQRREQYWDALEEVLRLGGRFTAPGRFEAPYTFTVELSVDDDPFRTGFITGDNVVLRDRPNRHGSAIGSLSYDIVTILDRGEGTRYREIRLASGRQGFVHEDYLRRPVDHRAIFEERDGKWHMVTFIAGD